MKRLTFAGSFVVLLSLSGCRPAVSPKPAPVATPAQPKPASATAEPSVAQAPAAASEKDDDVPSALPAASPDAAASNAPSPPIVQPEPGARADAPATSPAVAATTVDSETTSPPGTEPQRKRLVLYTPGGPLIVEMALRIAGVGATEMTDEFVDRLLKAADGDGDGKTTWTEAMANQRAGIAQFLGGGGNDAQTFYDRNRDGAVSRGELWNLLGHGDAGLAFRLSHVAGATGAADEVAALLDVDRDGVISAAEMEQAPARLRLADINDDERLTPEDLRTPDAMSQPNGMYMNSSGNVPLVAALLDEQTDWSVVQFELDERYLMHGQLRPEGFSLIPDVGAKLDANADGLLGASEAEILMHLSPHLQLEIDLGEEESPQGRLRAAYCRDELAAAAVDSTPADRSAQYVWPNLTLSFEVFDATASGDPKSEAEAVLAQFDADKNGYLEEGELPEERKGAFSGYDDNSDGKVYADELAAALREERAPLLNRVQCIVEPGEHSLLAALDANRDGRLSAREIQDSTDRLRSCDQDADERLTYSEIPTRISVRIERGEPSRGPVGPNMYAPPEVADDSAPPWFQRMDSNADGDISPREFLGSPDTFRRLDSDGDRLISLEEAVAIGAAGDAQAAAP